VAFANFFANFPPLPLTRVSLSGESGWSSSGRTLRKSSDRRRSSSSPVLSWFGLWVNKIAEVEVDADVVEVDADADAAAGADADADVVKAEAGAEAESGAGAGADVVEVEADADADAAAGADADVVEAEAEAEAEAGADADVVEMEVREVLRAPLALVACVAGCLVVVNMVQSAEALQITRRVSLMEENQPADIRILFDLIQDSGLVLKSSD